ncbi:hypothetical protein PINS_up024525 [Pythium insidiosum]|nr:hypothetical protein PINS_up024525 [Pythium insidiosum]
MVEVLAHWSGLEESPLSSLDGTDNIYENVALAFIFGGRFGFLAMAHGVKHTLTKRKVELLLYVLFVTHEYPFTALEQSTGANWEGVQALWNRVTVMMCILSTIHGKLQSLRSSKQSKLKTNGPTTKGISFNENSAPKSNSSQPRGPQRVITVTRLGKLKPNAVRPVWRR